LYRYVPVGLIEVLPTKMNHRPPKYGSCLLYIHPSNYLFVYWLLFIIYLFIICLLVYLLFIYLLTYLFIYLLIYQWSIVLCDHMEPMTACFEIPLHVFMMNRKTDNQHFGDYIFISCC